LNCEERTEFDKRLSFVSIMQKSQLLAAETCYSGVDGWTY
jgi:hypothetical protein